MRSYTSRDEPATRSVHVVGPLCESSDVLGRDRLLPPTEPGDVLLIDNAGAYGAVMASRYNLREPAEEVVVESAEAPATTPAR
jgi:diaminopimelate decarboxylase/aspartate kinase